MANKRVKPRRYLVTFIIIIIIGTLGVFFSKSDAGLRIIYQIAKSHLKEQFNYTLSIESISQNNKVGLKAGKLIFANQDSSMILSVDSLNADYSGIFEVFGRKHVDRIYINKPVITLYPGKTNEIFSLADIDVPEMFINSFILEDAQIKIFMEDTAYFGRINHASFCYSGQNGQSRLTVHNVDFNDSVGNIEIRDFSSDVTLKNNIAKLRDLTFNLNGSEVFAKSKVRFQPSLRFQGEFSIQNLVLARYIDVPFLYSEESVDCHLNISGDLKEFTGNSTLVGTVNHQIIDEGRLSFEFKDSTFYLLQGIARNKENDFALYGSYGLEDNYLNTTMSIYRFNSRSWINDLPEFRLEGRFRAAGYLDRDVKIGYEFNFMDLYDFEKIVLGGDVTLSGMETMVLDSASYMELPGGRLTMSGRMDGFDSMKVRVGGRLEYIDKISLGEFDIPDLYGIDISFSGRGAITDPGIELNLNIDSLMHDNFSSHNINLSVYGNQIISNPEGGALVSLNQTKYDSMHITEMETFLRLKDRDIAMEYFDISGNNYQFSLSGSVDDFEVFKISKLTGLYQDQPIYLLDPVSLTIREDKFILSRFEVLYKDAYLFGEFEKDLDQIKGSLNIADADIRTLPDIVPINQSIAGIVNMNIDLSGTMSRPVFNTEMTLEKGKFYDVNIEKIKTGISYRDSLLKFQEVMIRFAKERYISGMLNVPFQFDFSDYKLYRPILKDSLSGKFDVSRIRVNKLLPLFDINLNSSGELKLNGAVGGSLESPKIEAEMAISGPGADMITADSFYTDISYSDKKLYFNKAGLITENGSYEGFGFLPLDLGMGGSKEIFLGDSSMYCLIRGNDRDFIYLTPFIDILESLDGDIYTEFELSGTPNNPLKNGKVRIDNGELVVSLLENHIYNIDGTGTLENNVLDVDLQAKWPRVEYTLVGILGLSNQEEEAEYNFFTDGSIDLTEFSNIGFDLNVNGENLSVAVLGEDINLTSGDVNLEVKGYNPVSVTGDFQVREGVIGFDLNNINTASVESEAEKIGFEYVINAPIDRIYLRNQLIDATLEGEAVLIKRPYESQTRIGGNLNVTDGLFSYWASVFELQEGSITLDQFENNHELNFTAYKEINNNNIIASITGELDNPEINFIDENNELSQAEIVRELTIGEIESVFKTFGGSQSGTEATTTALLALAERPLEQQAQKLGNVGGLDRIDIKGGEGTYIDSTTAVVVGGRIGRNFYLTYEGSQANPLNIEVEYRLNNKVSVVANADEESVSGAVRLRLQY